MAITEDEREAYARQFREELELEHQRRIEKLQREKERRRMRLDERSRRELEAEKADIRDAMRKAFYEEKGYKLYTDSSGRDIWLTAEEYKYRTSRRRRRVKRKPLGKVFGLRPRTVGLYALAVLIAVAIGLAMTRGS